MLGISGFESSAQFVEEQKPGVFLKTLRNMWMAVAFFNPLLAVLLLATLPMEAIVANERTVLAVMAKQTGGDVLQLIVAVDAFVVLAGAVLTAYVGVTGLVRKMAEDRCLPQFLLWRNRWRGTNHIIIFGFFLLSASLLYIVRGDTRTLAGVYTFAFLGVMSLFSVGCILLKYKRPQLPREVTASWGTVLSGLAAVLTGLLGNVVLKRQALTYFALYFSCVAAVVFTMFQRNFVLKLVLHAGGACASSVKRCHDRFEAGIKQTMSDINDNQVIFFLKSNSLVVLNKAILYVRENEQTDKLTVVHCYDAERAVPAELSASVRLMDRIYPKLCINLLCVEGEFSPAMVRWVSRETKVPHNMMFMTCPDASFKHKIERFGGMRIITTIPSPNASAALVAGRVTSGAAVSAPASRTAASDEKEDGGVPSPHA